MNTQFPQVRDTHCVRPSGKRVQCRMDRAGSPQGRVHYKEPVWSGLTTGIQSRWWDRFMADKQSVRSDSEDFGNFDKV